MEIYSFKANSGSNLYLAIGDRVRKVQQSLGQLQTYQIYFDFIKLTMTKSKYYISASSI